MNKDTQLSGFSQFSIVITAVVWIYESVILGPSLGVIGQAFPGNSVSMLQLVMQAPLITAFIFSIISGKLANKYDKKNFLIIGLIIYGVVGLIPAFCSTMFQIVICPVGFSTAASNIGSMLITIAIGFLMMMSWKMIFYAFIVALIIAVIVAVGAQKSPPQKTAKEKKEGAPKVKLQGIFYLYTLAMMFVWITHAYGAMNFG